MAPPISKSIKLGQLAARYLRVVSVISMHPCTFNSFNEGPKNVAVWSIFIKQINKKNKRMKEQKNERQTYKARGTNKEDFKRREFSKKTLNVLTRNARGIFGAKTEKLVSRKFRNERWDQFLFWVRVDVS